VSEATGAREVSVLSSSTKGKQPHLCNATKKAKLDPASNLEREATYKATVTSGAQDLEGNALDQNPNLVDDQSKSWKFKVQ
jgi:hypothetical protein